MEPTTGHIETALHHKLIAALGLSGLVAVHAVPKPPDRYPNLFGLDNPMKPTRCRLHLLCGEIRCV